MESVGKIISWVGVAIATVGLLVGISPWTYSIYISMYPDQASVDGGVYPEMLFLLGMLPFGFMLALVGLALSKFTSIRMGARHEH